MKRVFLIVLDSVGAGALPDAERFGDVGAHTLRSISQSPEFHVENLKKLGIGNIIGLDFLGTAKEPTAAVARLREMSQGKDTTIGHWEIAGVISDKPLPTYPNGFPHDILDAFSSRTGRGILCNKPYSGTEVIKDFGDAHLQTGDLIVYTSADSVFQIAAHEDLVPLEQLYEYCRMAREILVEEHSVGRVIARPFVGVSGNYTRTANRRDFSLEPMGRTVLDSLAKAGRDVIAVGKITDIFAGRGITRSILTHGNREGMDVTLNMQEENFYGLCFVNLVDFDMLYGHRNNVDGYAKALSEFDTWLPSFLNGMKDDDVLLITADHGCDPGDISTDHTREYTPLLIVGNGIRPINLGERSSFADIAASVAEFLEVSIETAGESFFSEVTV